MGPGTGGGMTDNRTPAGLSVTAWAGALPEGVDRPDFEGWDTEAEACGIEHIGWLLTAVNGDEVLPPVGGPAPVVDGTSLSWDEVERLACEADDEAVRSYMQGLLDGREGAARIRASAANMEPAWVGRTGDGECIVCLSRLAHGVSVEVEGYPRGGGQVRVLRLPEEPSRAHGESSWIHSRIPGFADWMSHLGRRTERFGMTSRPRIRQWTRFVSVDSVAAMRAEWEQLRGDVVPGESFIVASLDDMAVMARWASAAAIAWRRALMGRAARARGLILLVPPVVTVGVLRAEEAPWWSLGLVLVGHWLGQTGLVWLMGHPGGFALLAAAAWAGMSWAIAIPWTFSVPLALSFVLAGLLSFLVEVAWMGSQAGMRVSQRQREPEPIAWPEIRELYRPLEATAVHIDGPE